MSRGSCSVRACPSYFMKRVNYNNRRFVARSSTANGEVNSATVFHYRQQDEVVWATYEGGTIRFGTLVAIADAQGHLEMRYQHVNARGELMTGECQTVPEVLADGRLRLHERWRWTSGDRSAGESVVEEIDARQSL